MRAVLLLTAIGAIVAANAVDPALAANQYDGTWSVSLVSRRGGCDAGYSWNIAVTDGHIGDSSFFVQLAGFVDRSGRVSLKASQGSSVLVASGTISGRSGSGTWLSPSNRCSGLWHATKAGS